MFLTPDGKWARLLAYVTALINQKLLLQNEHLIAENRILRTHFPDGMCSSDPERSTIADIGKRRGRTALRQLARVAKPETILACYRRLIARKFDGSQFRRSPGRPQIEPELEALIVHFASGNSGWGYDHIVGALANPGYSVSDQTVGNVLRCYGIQPAPMTTLSETIKVATTFPACLLQTHRYAPTARHFVVANDSVARSSATHVPLDSLTTREEGVGTWSASGRDRPQRRECSPTLVREDARA